MIFALKEKIATNWDSKRVLEIFKKSGLYFGSSALGLVISFFTLPIFAKFLSEKDFAIFNYFNNLTGFFAFAFSLQFASYYSAKYFRCNEEEKKELTGTLVTFLLLWNPILICIIYGILVVYCKYIDLNLPYYPYLIFSLLITAITIFKGFYLVKLRLDGNAFKYFLFNSFHKLIGVFVGITLMYVMYNHLAGRLWGLLTAEIVLGVASIWYIYKDAYFTINKETIKNTFKFVYPLIGASLIYFPITGLDLIVLERLNNTSELGYYSLGLTFASYLFMFTSSMLQAIEPDIIRCTIQGNFKKLSKIIIGFTTFCTLASFIFIQVSKYIIDFLTRGKFVLSTVYCNILTVSFIFVITFSITNIMLIALQKNKAIFYTNLVGCICSIGIYTLAAYYSGFYGVAVGRVFLYIILTVVAAYFIYKELKRLKYSEEL